MANNDHPFSGSSNNFHNNSDLKKVSNVAGNTYYLETAILKNQSHFGSEL